MRIIRGVAVILACAFFALPAKGAQLPFLRGPAAYAGEYGRADALRRVSLFLGTERNFLLREEMLAPDGAAETWESSGTWHQIRDNAFVQLSNNAFLRLLAVGATGALYLGLHVQGGDDGAKQATVVLRPVNSALHGEEIQRIPPKERETGYTPGYFLDAVAGSLWKMTRVGREAVANPYITAFIPQKGSYSGKLEIFDGTRRVFGSFSLDGEGLALAADGAGPVLSPLMEQTRFWQLAGDVLELWDDKHIVATLERAR